MRYQTVPSSLLAAIVDGTRRNVTSWLVIVSLVSPAAVWRLQAQAGEPESIDGHVAILTAFDRHRVVAIGDLHGCQELYEFIFELIRRPELGDRVQDIVVEFGNALYQDVIDRYVSGADVPPDELIRVWRDHTNPIVFDSPVYEAFFRTIKDVNAMRQPGKRFRVHLGDPPIDWSTTTTNQQWGRMLFQRDSHFASIVERIAFTEGRRVLLIIGGAHLVRRVSKDNVTARVEAQRPGAFFLIIPHSGFTERNDELEARMSAWKPGSLAMLNGTWLGALPPGYRWPQMKGAKIARADGQASEARLEDVADAWLYVGRRDLLTEALPFPGIYRDAYWNELQRRHLIMWGSPLTASSGDINTSGRYYIGKR